MAKLLEHKGVVREVGDRLVEVEMVVEDACAGCKAKGLCGVDEDNKRFVTVYDPLAQYYAVGEEVMVGVSETMGMKAATYAYIIPFFILLGVLLGTLNIGWSETSAGLTSLGVMCLYYVVLWFFRGRIEKEIDFKIRKI
ncbi:MAG: SoxR reducing system RseC family protein [Rikenellaceae bacterium]|jgi:sigma-E factor negative regulatory protein RseC|nr:SoxR reducing system RseC family protein [Rikenellaceae bacterium]